MNLEKMKLQYKQLAESARTVMLSTVGVDGSPLVSYAPFVMHGGKIYIYISRIAHHYRHMELTARVDAMLIEDESKTGNLFARQRARFECTAVNLGNEGNEHIFELFGQSFGHAMMNMLRGLDFSLFKLTPRKGRYVAGFGQAYDIDLTADRFEHVGRDGHTSSST